MTVVVSLLLPDATPLIGMLMLGNLFRESGVVGRLSDTAQNALMNIITIFLGVTVGATANAAAFLESGYSKNYCFRFDRFLFRDCQWCSFGKFDVYTLWG